MKNRWIKLNPDKTKVMLLCKGKHIEDLHLFMTGNSHSFHSWMEILGPLWLLKKRGCICFWYHMLPKMYYFSSVLSLPPYENLPSVINVSGTYRLDYHASLQAKRDQKTKQKILSLQYAASHFLLRSNSQKHCHSVPCLWLFQCPLSQLFKALINVLELASWKNKDGWLYQLHFSAVKHLQVEYKAFFTKEI